MSKFKKSEIDTFNSLLDIDYEKAATDVRKKFLKIFPKSKISKLRVDDYVIGKGNDSFCAMIEAKSKLWANIQGATSSKFGLYYGRTKSDSSRIYRPSKKFGETKDAAFFSIMSALRSLVETGNTKDFQAIDSNPLSQMVKAKILSLYYPDKFISICSEGHINAVAKALKLPETPYLSEKQHLILKEKLRDKRVKSWSNPKFVQFLYHSYLPEHARKFGTTSFRKPVIRSPPKVNMEDVQGARSRIGRISEKYALNWEKRRLKNLGYDDLVKKIDDRTDRPGYGYDFLSYSAPGKERYIEVKTLAKKGDTFRFFMSGNEFEKSKSSLKTGYFFYLVTLGPESKPVSVEPILAKELHSKGVFTTAVHEVFINIA